MVNIKALGIPRILAIMALVGAIWAAYYKGDLLAYAGIAFYALCITALIIKHPRAGLLLLAAVGVHVGLVSYSLWRWQTLGITPCHFCFLAAGSALVAAVVYYRPRLVVMPLAVMIVGVYLWPSIFWVNQAQGNSQVGVQAAEPVSTEVADDQQTEGKTQTSSEVANNKSIPPSAPAVKTVTKPAASASTPETIKTPEASKETATVPVVPPVQTTTPPTTPPKEPVKPPGG